MTHTRIPTLALVVALLAALVGTVVTPTHASASEIGNTFFQHTWQRTDELVASGAVSRTWIWGPEPFTGPAGEGYSEAPGGERIVQYFDKSRMEINDPDHDPNDIWYVTNGLLAKELITGQMQVGDNERLDFAPADIQIAGDPSDASPTYASFSAHLSDVPLDEGAEIVNTIARDGSVDCCVDDAHGVTAGMLVAETGHRVASVFQDYLNSDGLIIERDYRTRGALFANPFYATGYPIAEAYWALVPVKDVSQWVLVQPFERRVLTYTPGNAEGWQVEMGNVGRHYYWWRYGEAQPAAAPDWQLPAWPQWVPDGQQVNIPDLDAHYDLHITNVDVDSGSVTAHEEIRIDAFTGARPDRLYLQVVPAAYGYFTLDSVTVAGEIADAEWVEGGFILSVGLPDLPTPLTLALDFRLDVGLEATGWGGTSLDSGILRLGYWFPIISDQHPFTTTLDPSQAQVADYDVTVDIAPDVVVAHTGTVAGEDALDDGRARYYYQALRVRDFALVLSRNFSVTHSTLSDGTELSIYLSEPSDARIATITSAAEDTVAQLSSLIGWYPYDTLSYVDAGPTMPGGLEFPTLIYINPAYTELDRLIYHETAHQWMYAIIGNRTVVDGWIDEGAAEFFERGLPSGFTEVPDPPVGGYTYWLDTAGVDLPDDASRQWYYSIYEQGARFYYHVAWTMGWDAFWDAFREVYARDAFGIVTPVETLSIFQEHSPTDLRPLYAEYFQYPWIGELLAPGG